MIFACLYLCGVLDLLIPFAHSLFYLLSIQHNHSLTHYNALQFINLTLLSQMQAYLSCALHTDIGFNNIMAPYGSLPAGKAWEKGMPFPPSQNDKVFGGNN